MATAFLRLEERCSRVARIEFGEKCNIFVCRRCNMFGPIITRRTWGFLPAPLNDQSARHFRAPSFMFLAWPASFHGYTSVLV